MFNLYDYLVFLFSFLNVSWVAKTLVIVSIGIFVMKLIRARRYWFMRIASNEHLAAGNLDQYFSRYTLRLLVAAILDVIAFWAWVITLSCLVKAFLWIFGF